MTIVLPGARQPAAFKRTDAHVKVDSALAALQTLPHGICLAMNRRLFDPEKTRKILEEDQYEEEG